MAAPVEEKYVCAVAEEEVEMAEAECNELAGLEVAIDVWRLNVEMK